MARQTKTTKKTTGKVNNRTSKSTKTKKPVTKKAPKAEKPVYEPTEKDIKIKNEVKLLIALVVTILVFLSNFGLLSPVGDYVSMLLFGLFGIIAYVMPIVAFLGIAFLLSNIKNRKAVIKFVAGVLLCLFVSAIIQLIFKGYNEGVTAFDYYSICGKGKNGGGLFGALIVNGLSSTLGVVGAYIIVVVFIIILLVIMTERSFVGGVKSGSKKVYNHAKEDAIRIKDNVVTKAENRQYEKKRRINNKVKGVSMQKIDGEAGSTEDVHEITGEFAGKLPENAHLYRGHVDVDKYVASSMEDERETNKKIHIEQTRHEEINNDYAKEKTSARTQNYDHPKYEEPRKEELPQVDEEGFFKPKERIVVSEEAKNVMNRKPFGAPVSETKTAGSGLLSNAQANEAPRAAASSSSAGSVSGKRRKEYVLPSTNLLNRGTGRSGASNSLELRDTAKKLETILENFGITAEVVDYSRGPSVTRYEIQPEIGTRLANITKLTDDIKLHLAATDIRIEPIPGKSTIGIEVPNEGRDSVLIRELIESPALKNNGSKLAFAAGKDIAGEVIIGDIAKMPHLLVAGTTGSGKSVFTNSIIMSILFRATPDEVRLIIVDPKVVEFGVYNGIPHLLQPVVTDPRLASNTLKWAVAEMSDRYKKFAELNVRDIKGYNEKIMQAGPDENGNMPTKLPQIVIVIDELADLMMVAAKEVEESICRIAQLARAAGIHLIIATQRPSVNVVTGLIKANVPSRVALMVSSGVDSRTIIDQNGAEKLLGNGDMLFYPSGYVKPVRLQGAFVSDGEVSKVVEFWKNQAGDVNYDDSIARYVESQNSQSAQGSASVEEAGDGRDEYFFDAARFVIQKQKASTSMLQRMFKIGFNRAARIMDQMCEAGVVGEEEGTKPRKVLMTLEELEELK